MTAELHRKLWALRHDEGLGYREIARLSTLGHTSVGDWANRHPADWKGRYTPHPSDKRVTDALDAWEASRQEPPEPRPAPEVVTARVFDRMGEPQPEPEPEPEAEVERVFGGTGVSVLTVMRPPRRDIEQAGARSFAAFEKKSTAYLEHRAQHPPGLLHLRIDTDRPIALANVSDLHLGNKGTDHRRAREDAERIAETEGAFAVFGGDGIDNFIKHASAMIASGSEPEEEYEALEWYLSRFGGRLLGGVTGNHDYWSKRIGGIDHLRGIFSRLGLCYARHRMRLVLELPGATYRIELRHNYRFKSSINPTNQFNRMWEKSDWQWDIGLVGHTHDGPWCAPIGDRHGRERWGGQAGSYKVADAHGEQWGFNAATPSTPVFILQPDYYAVTGVNDLRRGLTMFTAWRNAA